MASQNTPTVDEKQLDDGGFDFLGKELDDNARIWNVYRDEITADDKAHGFELWLQTLDILLIFAGLFSAVVTTFLIDSYKLLQKPDQNDFIATALYALVVATNNSALLVDLPKPRPLSSTPSSSERWVNALWFTSLIIALAVALLAILAKQWLQEFHRRLADSNAAGSTPTPSNEWTRKRWFYLRGMTQTWPMDGFITYLLPVLLHIALFLFLAGLSLFLWSVDDIVSRIVLALSAFIIAFYVACTLLPLWCPDAPTATPLLNQILAVVHTVPTSILHISIAFCKLMEKFETPSSSFARSRNRLEGALVRLQETTDPSIVSSESPDERDRRFADILTWLIVTCTSENAVMIGFQGVGALDLDSQVIPRLRKATVGMSALAHFGSNKTPSALDAIRAIRSELVLGRGTWRFTQLVLNVPPPMLDALKDIHIPEAMLLARSLAGKTGPISTGCSDEITPYLDWTSAHQVSSLASIARLLLQCRGRMHFDVLTTLLLFLDYRTLPLQYFDHILSLCGDRAYTTESYDAVDRCFSTLLHATSDDEYKVRATRIIWRLLSYNPWAPQLSGLRDLDTFQRLFLEVPEAFILDLPRPDLCKYAGDSFVLPVLALLVALALLQPHFPPLNPEQGVEDEVVRAHFQRNLPLALGRLLEAAGAVRNLDVWVALLKLAVRFRCDSWITTAICWLERTKQLIIPPPYLYDTKKSLFEAIPWRSYIESGDSNALHLARHFRELFPDWRQRLTQLDDDDGVAHFAEIVKKAQICTARPGRRPAQWADESKGLASATVPPPAVQQLTSISSPIAATTTTSSDPLSDFPTAQPVPIVPSSPAPSAALAASNSPHPIDLDLSIISIASSISLDDQCALPAVSVLEPEPVLAPTSTPRIDDEVESASGLDASAFPTPAAAVPEPEARAQAPVADVTATHSFPAQSAAPAASNSVNYLLRVLSILEPEPVLIPAVTPHIDAGAESMSGPDVVDYTAEARVRDGTVVSAASAFSEALESDSDALSSPLPQVLAPGPAHLGTDEDASDSSSSTGGRDADVDHPTSNEYASDDREPASELHKTARSSRHGASSEVAPRGTGRVGVTTELSQAVTPEPDAGAQNLISPINEPDDQAPTQPPRTTETDTKLPRSKTPDDEDM